MTELMIFIWVIGWLYTAGVVKYRPWFDRDDIARYYLNLLIWPIYLGENNAQR